MRSGLPLRKPVSLHEVGNKGNRFDRRHLAAKYVIFLSDSSFNIFNKLNDFFFTIAKYKMIEIYAWQSINIIFFVNFDFNIKLTTRMNMHKVNENS